MVNALIKQDYLVEKPSVTDGRSYTVRTTDKGKELVENTFNDYFKTMELLKKKMSSKEFSLFTELIQKANSILSEEKLQ